MLEERHTGLLKLFSYMEKKYIKIWIFLVVMFFVFVGSLLFWLKGQFKQVNVEMDRIDDEIGLIDERLEKTEKDTLSLKDQGYVERSDLNLVASKIMLSVVFILGTDNATSYNESDKIITNTSTNADISGTGFFISKNGYIATAKHVITDLDKNNIHIIDYMGEIYTASLFAEDEKSDTAILKIEGTSFNPVELGSFQNIDPGEEIGFVGFNPGFNVPLIRGGNISVKGLDGNGTKFFTINSFVNKGNSGSPVFSLLTGRVLGIIISRRHESQETRLLDRQKFKTGLSIGNLGDLGSFVIDLYNLNIENSESFSQAGLGTVISIDELFKYIKL